MLNKLKHFAPVFCLVLICLLYIVFCCLNINGPIWYDEAYSHYLVRGNFAEIWSLTAVDVHPPVYYFALKLWTVLFGTGIVTMRLMSVFFGVIALIFAFLVIKRHFSTRTALIASLFMGLSPLFIRYGQEMRMYTLVLAIVMIATYVLSRALSATLPIISQKSTLAKKQKSAKAPSKSAKLPKSARRYWALYAILVALGMWTQYLSALAWLAQLFYILYRFGIFHKGGLKNFWHNSSLRRIIFGTYGLAVLLFLPWLPSFIAQTASVQGGFWIGDVSAQTIVDYFTEATLFTTASEATNWLMVLLILIIILIVILALRAYRVLKIHSATHHLHFLMFMVFIPPLLLLLLSLPPLSPVFVNRYVTYSAAFLWLFIGVILSINLESIHPNSTRSNSIRSSSARFNSARFNSIRSSFIRSKLVPILSTVVILIAAGIGLANVTNRAPASQAALVLQSIQQASTAGEPVLIGDDWNFYETVPYSTADQPIYFYSGWFEHDWSAFDPIRQYRYGVVDNLEDFLASQDRFWLFVSADTDLFSVDNLAIDSEFAGFEVVNTIAADNHTAYEFARSE